MTQKKNEFFTLKHDKEKGFKGHHLEFFSSFPLLVYFDAWGKVARL